MRYTPSALLLMQISSKIAISDTISLLIAVCAIILLYERLSRHICLERCGIPRLQVDCAWTGEFAD
jgi:hypothetical protein